MKVALRGNFSKREDELIQDRLNAETTPKIWSAGSDTILLIIKVHLFRYYACGERKFGCKQDGWTIWSNDLRNLLEMIVGLQDSNSVADGSSSAIEQDFVDRNNALEDSRSGRVEN